MKRGGEPMSNQTPSAKSTGAVVPTNHDWDAALTELEARIRELRETRQTLSAMKVEDMRLYLSDEYTSIKSDWVEALDEYATKATDLGEARRLLAELKTDKEFHETNVLLTESHKEGRINGSNAETRKLQAGVLLATLADEDSDYAAIVTALEETQLHVDELQRDLDNLEKRISFLRNQSRMVSGLSYALAGV
jgi:uncharacterized protein YeeX (DUF496 family)